jgi:Protein of unknown function (DUF3987)
MHKDSPAHARSQFSSINRISTNGDGNGNGSSPPPDEPDPFKGAYDCFFIVPDRDGLGTLTQCGKYGLKVGYLGQRGLKRSIKKEDVIVVAPTHGPGRLEIIQAANELRQFAAKLEVWDASGLGTNEAPDLKTFDEKYSAEGIGGVARMLCWDEPWRKFRPRPVPSSNGHTNGKHSPSIGASDETTDDWKPLRLEGLPPVEPFPVGIFPIPVAQFVNAVSDAIGCQRDLVSLPVLAVSAGAIGRSVSLVLKPGYCVTPCVYMSPVGPPSDGKTPAQKVVVGAVREIDDTLASEHATAMSHWEQVLKANPPGKGEKPDPAPRPRRIDIDDATLEVLPRILRDNPRGLIMIKDELTAFVLGMNQYKAGGKGSDRSNVLKMWSGDDIVTDRVNHENGEPLRCRDPFLTIFGGLVPDNLGHLADPSGKADGFIERFLLAYPDPIPVPDWSDVGVSAEAKGQWHAIVKRLWDRPQHVVDGKPVPHFAHFTPAGKARWAELYNAHVAEMNSPDFEPFLRGTWGKFREYAGRFAINLTLMHHAADATVVANVVPNVGPDRVNDAWTLVGYFKSHARRVHSVIARGPGTGKTRAVKAILDWVRDGSRTEFTERDFKQARRWVEHEDLAEALAYLSDRNAIRPHASEATKASQGAGRPASPSYGVNPLVLDTQNTQNTQNS